MKAVGGNILEKWDVHTHTTLSPATYDLLEKFTGYADFVRVAAHATEPCCANIVRSDGTIFRKIGNNAYDASVRVQDCDRFGITRQVLSPTPAMIPDMVDDAGDAAEICRILNDDNARLVAQFPERFTALAALPMRHPKHAIEEMERVHGLGFHGFEINSNIAGVDLDHPDFFPVFESAARLGMAVFVHPWGGFMAPQEERLKSRMNEKRNWRPWLLGMGLETALAFDALCRGGVHERLPHLRVLYAHGGGVFPALLGRMEHGAYCRPDLFRDISRLNPYQTIEQCGVYVDSLVHDPLMLQMLIQMFGVNRIAMGSDYPYPLGEMEPFDTVTKKDNLGNSCPYPQAKALYPGKMIETLNGLCDEDKNRMLAGTAKEWLGFVDE